MINKHVLIIIIPYSVLFINNYYVSKQPKFATSSSNGCPSLAENNECIISDADIRRDVSGDGRQVRGELSLYKHTCYRDANSVL